MARISVSVVTYNSADVIDGVLKSLLQHEGEWPDVYIIDNHSSDDTIVRVRAHCPKATVLPQSDNRGFGAGHNAVLPLLRSTYHVIVNPDITFEPTVLSALADYLDAHPDTVAVTPTVLNPDGTVQYVPRCLPRRRYMFAGKLERICPVPFRKWRDEYTRRLETFDGPTPVTFCTGCFMMVRTALFLELGGFDDRFFMYCEDADLSRRLAEHGRLMLIPGVAVTHEWTKASGKSGKFLKIHLRSMRQYFKQWRRAT